jgi:signal transduction histidine kinase/CheY-like chemotaxis protein
VLLGEADGGPGREVHAWSRASQEREDEVAAAIAARPEPGGLCRVPSVAALPAGGLRLALEARGVCSWLCLPLRDPARPMGFLVLEALLRERRWREADIALLRTAGEIFASALERERAEAAREALETRLRQAERMEAIGTLAGGIAHDFNNILGAMLGYAEMALALLPADSRARHHVREVMKAGQRAVGVIDQILSFSRRGARERRPVRMAALVEEAIALLRVSLPATVAIRVRTAEGDAVVAGDAAQLQQVVMNLATNAAQAMAGHGTLEVALDTVELARETVLSHGTLAPGAYVRLIVRDTGHGMDPATLARVFEPFFTTKAAGAGTGLGLASVHGIVEDHGGAVHVRSRPGEGSTFAAYLARAEAAAEALEAETPPLARGHGETVLLVDDERPLVLLGEEILAALGYEPVGFDSSAEALAAFRAAPGRFDLVLADEVMPGLTGSQLAAAVHQIRPDLPVVLMTGYGGPVLRRQRRAAAVREVLKKPLLARDIAESLARHLQPAA